MSPVAHSGIAMAAVSAVCLNLMFNVLGSQRAAVSGARASALTCGSGVAAIGSPRFT